MTDTNPDPDYRKLLLSLIASLTLADHMGDVGNEMVYVLEQLGIEYEDDDSGDGWGDLPKVLHEMGVKTLYDTEVWSPEDHE